MSPKSSDVATADDGGSAMEAWNDEYATYESLSEGADETLSRDTYTSADEKDELIGVPFVITGITFRPSDKKEGGDYVSLEATTKDNERIVINDGSTGIRRQIVAYAAFKKWLKPAEPKDGDDVKSPLDLPVGRCEFGEGTDVKFAEDGGMTVNIVTPFRLRAKKGLRRSDYDGPTGKATTFYLA